MIRLRTLARNTVIGIAALVISVTPGSPGAASGSVNLELTTPNVFVSMGDTVNVTALVPSPGSAFNAFDLDIQYDQTRLQFVPTNPVTDQVGSLVLNSCSNYFHGFSQSPGTAVASLSLLCQDALMYGGGPVYQVRFRVLAASGTTVIGCGSGTGFYDSGVSVSPVNCQSLTLNIGGTSAAPVVAGHSGGLLLAPLWPNPRTSTGLLMLSLDLVAPDHVSVEIFDASGRLRASRDPEFVSQSSHTISWDAPPLGSGMYFVRISSPLNGQSVRTFTEIR